MSTYDSEKKIEGLISNDLSPQLSTIDILSSLKLIGHFENQIEEHPDKATSKVAKEELKYLGLAMKALEDNPALTSRFGSGFAGAMAVTGLLKQRQSERTYKKIIDDILDTPDSGLDLDTSVVRVNNKSGKAIGGRDNN